MKNNYRSIRMLAMLFCITGMNMVAQLNGLYTINSGSGTGGTNFQTFAAFASALNANGVSGPVTVNVVASSGPYVEQVTFNQPAGVSATNTITINGNGNVIQFTGSSTQPWVILLSGADRMFWHNMNVRAFGTYAFPLVFTGGADYNMFASCTFSCDPNSTGGTTQIPVMWSGSSSNYSTGGATGRFNTLQNCQLFSGYFGFSMYNPSPGVGSSDNNIIGCRIEDFYVYGTYCYYTKNLTMTDCIIERTTRTNFTTCYGTFFGYNEGLKFERNHIRKLFFLSPTNTNQTMGIYGYMNAVGGGANPNYIRNNIISDITTNGALYGIYFYAVDGDITHNTISIDHTTSTAASTTYGMYTYGNAGYPVNVKNNLITITRGGSGPKYGIYWGTAGNSTSTHNNIYVAGTNTYTGYYNSAHASIASLQSVGMEQNSISMDPIYTNMAGGNFLPSNVSMDNLGTPMGVPMDQQKMPRSGVTPDIGALEFLSANCLGVPNPGSVVTPTYAICAGETANLSLSNFSSDLGITYQWYYSLTSAVGPFTLIPGANSVLFDTPPVNSTTWFQVVVTCTNSSQNVSPVGIVNVEGVTTHTAPYYESFEGISLPNRLPNCSWTSPDIGAGANTHLGSNTLGRTPRTGTKFASFNYMPLGTKRFYTNGIWLNSNVTYSASVWYQTEYYGYNNWTDLSIVVGPNQNATGQQTVASTMGPAVSNVYKSLSNTFQVANSGYYYVEIRATSTSGSAQYLSWDDLRIEIPCSVNSPTMTVSSSAASICANDPVTLSAFGADTYSWSTGALTNIETVNPQFAGQAVYYVTGTHSLSGCAVTHPLNITVNPVPFVSVFAVPPTACAGSPVNLYAFGANNYLWAPSGTGPQITVKPNTSTTYSVEGTNQFGCKSTAVLPLTVNQLPVITALHPAEICIGDVVMLNASGADTYTFMSANGLQLINPAPVSPQATTQYTVVGADLNGCSGVYLADISVRECVGLNEVSGANGIRVYPNPASSLLTVEVSSVASSQVVITDVTGRVVRSLEANGSSFNLDIHELANGVYYVMVQSQESSATIRIIKE